MILWVVMGNAAYCTNLDSLLTEAKNEKNSIENRVLCYDELSYQNSGQNPTLAIEYSNLAVQLARTSDDSLLVAKALNGLSIPYISSGKYFEAKRVIGDAIRADSSDVSLKGRLHSKLGLILQELLELEEALQHQIIAQKAFEQTMDSVSLAQTYINIGNLLTDKKDYQGAFDNFEKAEPILAKYNATRPLGNLYYHLATTLKAMEKLDLSLEYISKSEEYYRTLNSNYEISTVLTQKGSIQNKLKQYEESAESYSESISLSKSVGDSIGIALNYINLGNLYQSLDDEEKSYQSFQKAIDYGRNQGIDLKLTSAYKHLTHYAVLQGDKKLSKLYLHRYDSLTKARYDLEESSNLQELMEKYKTTEKELTISQQDLQIEKQNQALVNEKNKNLMSVGAFLFVLLIGGVGFAFYRWRQKQRLELAIVNEQKAGLNNMLEAVEEEKKRISQELHDGIGQEMSYLKLGFDSLNKSIESSRKEEATKYANQLKITANEIRTISHQLMPRELMDSNLLEATQNLMQSLFKDQAIEWQMDQLGMEKIIPKQIEVHCFRIIQELLTNCIKHSQASSVSLQLLNRKNKLVVHYEDNGVGFDPKAATNGIGMKNIKDRLSLLNAELVVENDTPNQTSIRFTIDLNLYA
ncbi:tetratricopeptide repeat protein [bacterium SCSIO 12741]|nr:tetratricopeptide repeat protein [bacterium SCSIO 12741]